MDLSISFEAKSSDHYKIKNIFDECYKIDFNEEPDCYYWKIFDNLKRKQLPQLSLHPCSL